MIYAKIDETKTVIDTIVCNEFPSWLEGTYVECPSWIGIGMSINTPEPESTVVQPTVEGAQTL